MTQPPFALSHLDHVVLTVSNIDITCEFYTTVLGMAVVTFGDDRKALQFGSQKINLHQLGSEFVPNAAHATPGSADLCFITTTPLLSVIDHLRHQNVTILEGPVQRTGAMGAIISIYIHDPDQNLIEIANYLTRDLCP